MASGGPGPATAAYRRLASGLGLQPIQVILRDVRRHGMDPSHMRALEVFGYTGERLTRHYADRVGSLDVWEIDPRHEAALRRNLPRADVAIVDSFAELARTDKVFDLVVADNPVWPVEHFPIFPDVFRVLSDEAVLVMVVIPEASRLTRRRYPELMSRPHLDERRRFYRTRTPERIPRERLVAHYRALGEQHGFSLGWHRFAGRREIDRKVPRRVSMSLLALGLRRA